MKTLPFTSITLGILALAVASGCGSNSDTGNTDTNKSAGGSTSVAGNATGGPDSTIVGGSSTTAGTTSTAAGGTSAGGNQGTGGTSVPSATGTLGQACSPVGTLACNGIGQKLTLVCGASGKWETNQTCNVATQVCDPRPGSTQGTCQEQDPACATQTAGAQFCNNYAEWTCDAWGMKATKVRDCPIGACIDGKCVEATGCSTAWNFLSCSSDCPSMLDSASRCDTTFCAARVSSSPTDGNSGSAVVHLSYANGQVPQYHSTCATRRYFTVFPMGDTNSWIRVAVASPWKVSSYADQMTCAEALVSANCETLPGGTGFSVFTDDATAPPVNVGIQASPTKPAACQ